MGGWTRSALVLSAIYWVLALLVVWVAYVTDKDETAWDASTYAGVSPHASWVLISFGVLAALYAAGAAIWWALAGFFRDR